MRIAAPIASFGPEPRRRQSQRVRRLLAPLEHLVAIFAVLSILILSSPLALGASKVVMLGSQSGGYSTGTIRATDSPLGAYWNQKSMVQLTSGRLVARVNSTAVNAKFMWSDTGATGTWTDFGADIDGWLNGSIASYQDTNGVERIMASWTQSGTGGGRAAQNIYIACGTLNTARTSITWSINQVSANLGLDDFTDICVMPVAAGAGYGLFAWSYSGTTRAIGYTFGVSSSGVISMGTILNGIGTDGAGTTGTYPSVEIDQATGRVFATWSKGSGVGQFFRTGSWNGSVWTWAAEFAVDASYYAVGSNFAGGSLRWDGTRVVIGGTFGGDYQIRVWDSSNFTSFTQRVNISTGGVHYFTAMAVDRATGNVFLFSSLYNGTAYSSFVYHKLTRSGSSLTDGGLVTISSTSAGTTYAHSATALAASGWILASYRTGASASYSQEMFAVAA